LNDNINHTTFIKDKVQITIKQTKNLQEIYNQSAAFGSTNLKARQRFIKFRTTYNFDKIKPYSSKKITELEEFHLKKSDKLDSITNLITVQQNSFDSLLSNLYLNIWPQIFKHDSILVPFKKCIMQRRFLKDNYKKIIVDWRKKIYPMELEYKQTIDAVLYNPISESVALFKMINKNITIKQTLQSELLKLKVELYKTKAGSETDISLFKKVAITQTENDFCWLKNNYPKLGTTVNGLYILRNKQKNLLSIIAFENEIERQRKSIINKSMKLGYKESNTYLANETKHLNKKLKEITKYTLEIKDSLNFDKKRYSKNLIRIFKLLNRI
jgi:hypothetical protein